MPNPIQNPHDAFMKSMLADMDVARDFLANLMPSHLLRLLDMSTLKSEHSSFITEELQEVFADAVFTVQLQQSEAKGEESFISILLEHKSYADEQTAFQILLYLAQGYREQLKSRLPLRPIIPMLFYHGKEGWEFKPIPSFFGGLHIDLIPYVPSYEAIFADLNQMRDEDILQVANAWVRAALLTQKYSRHPEELAKRMVLIFQTLAGTPKGNFLSEFIVYYFSVTEISPGQLRQAIQPLPLSLKTDIMSTYEMILQQGIEKGIEKGIERGIEQGIEQGIEIEKAQVILRGHEEGLSLDTLAALTGFSLEQVRQIIDPSAG